MRFLIGIIVGITVTWGLTRIWEADLPPPGDVSGWVSGFLPIPEQSPVANEPVRSQASEPTLAAADENARAQTAERPAESPPTRQTAERPAASHSPAAALTPKEPERESVNEGDVLAALEPEAVEEERTPPADSADPSAEVPDAESPRVATNGEPPATERVADMSAAEPVPEITVAANTRQPNSWESAWVPFRTESSARGFAAMLTRELQHPFDVRREAAGRYRVTFSYADVDERERVRAAVRSLAGDGT